MSHPSDGTNGRDRMTQAKQCSGCRGESSAAEHDAAQCGTYLRTPRQCEVSSRPCFSHSNTVSCETPQDTCTQLSALAALAHVYLRGHGNILSRNAVSSIHLVQCPVPTENAAVGHAKSPSSGGKNITATRGRDVCLHHTSQLSHAHVHSGNSHCILLRR